MKELQLSYQENIPSKKNWRKKNDHDDNAKVCYF